MRRNWLWWVCQQILQVFFTVWLRYRARGCEKLPATGGALLIANHQSFLDPLLVGLPLTRPVSYIARDSLFRVPVVGWILRNTYVKPISREAASAQTIRESVQRMEAGFLCGIFPEGTRSDDGQVGEFKPGFIALVRRSSVPIYPVGIAGAIDALPRGAVWLRPRRVCVVFGDPLPPEEVLRLKEHGREAELVQAVHARVVACQQAAEELLKGKRRKIK